jgi:hypothetical protein
MRGGLLASPLSYMRALCQLGRMDEDEPGHALAYLIAAAIMCVALVHGAFGAVVALMNVLSD